MGNSCYNQDNGRVINETGLGQCSSGTRQGRVTRTVWRHEQMKRLADCLPQLRCVSQNARIRGPPHASTNPAVLARSPPTSERSLAWLLNRQTLLVTIASIAQLCPERTYCAVSLSSFALVTGIGSCSWWGDRELRSVVVARAHTQTHTHMRLPMLQAAPIYIIIVA